MNLERAIAQCRQWLFPPEFRIQLDGREEWTNLLLELLPRKPGPEDAEGGDGAKAPSGLIDEGFAIKLSNGLYRLKRTLSRLEKSGNHLREVEHMKQAFERTDPLLETYGIRYVDLTGQQFDPGANRLRPAARKARGNRRAAVPDDQSLRMPGSVLAHEARPESAGNCRCPRHDSE